MAKPTVDYKLTATDDTKKALNSAEKRFTKLAKVGVAAVATAAAAAGLAMFKLGSDAVKSADQIGKLSAQLGISEKALSQYKFIASQTGVEFNTLTMAFQRATRRIAEAAQGTGEAKGALKELNLNAVELNKLAPDQQFEAMAKALSGVSNQADKVRLSFKLFDSEGVRLLRTIDATGGSMDELKKRSDELGGTIDKQLTQQAAAVADAWDETGTALDGVGNSLLRTFGGAVTATANLVTALIVRTRKLGEEFHFLAVAGDTERLAQLQDELKGINSEISAARTTGSMFGPARLAGIILENNALAQQAIVTNEIAEIQERLAAAPPELPPTPKVVGAGEDEAAITRTETAIARLIEQMRIEEETVNASYMRRNNIIEANTESGSDLERELKFKNQEKMKADLIKHQAKMGNIEAKGIIARQKFEKKTTLQQTAFILGSMAQLTSGVAQENKTLFKINKAAAIGNAVVSAYQGISMTLGAYPYPINIGLAALHAVTAFAQIKSIKATTFNGGGGGTTPSLAGSSGTINSIPVQQQEIAPENDVISSTQPVSNVIEINFSGGITDTNAVRDFMENDLAEAIRDGVSLGVQVVTV